MKWSGSCCDVFFHLASILECNLIFLFKSLFLPNSIHGCLICSPAKYSDLSFHFSVLYRPNICSTGYKLLRGWTLIKTTFESYSGLEPSRCDVYFQKWPILELNLFLLLKWCFWPKSIRFSLIGSTPGVLLFFFVFSIDVPRDLDLF